MAVDNVEVAQDRHLAENQEHGFRCGDNGIFKGVPVTDEQKELTRIAKDLYEQYGCDGKYVLDVDRLIICQSNAPTEILRMFYPMRRSIRWATGQRYGRGHRRYQPETGQRHGGQRYGWRAPREGPSRLT